MKELRSTKGENSISWKVIRVGNLLYEQHERDGRIVGHKMFGDPTITLISGEKNILVDPGYGPYRERINRKSEEKLQENILRKYLRLAEVDISDINIVFITHHHMDHFNLLGMFEGAGAEVISDKDDGELIISGVEVMRTPGHDPHHCSLKFTSNENDLEHRIIIAGDAVLNLDYFKELAPYWMNMYTESEVRQAREDIKRISDEADIIVPGHGQPFANDWDLRSKWI
jgi:glyoxylase-like metal-dependent hydrolase (beta-lactamase superfamily II)